jgi:asparagine synthase (glutamine-hydrolysing)
MCGLTGFFDTSLSLNAATLQATVQGMAKTIFHRGPDDAGEWVDAQAGIALGSRRLAIVDLSAAGHQPMCSHSGRYVIAYNGEVYNFGAIRQELASKQQAPPFHGHSDTEVILAAVEAWGLESAVRRFIGMFAFALWDRKERTLHLVRDRLGVKPLYYGWVGKTLLFGSELKALRAHPDFAGEIDRGSVALLMRHNYIPAPYTIYQGISKLPPGSILTVPLESPLHAEPTVYWSVKTVAECGIAAPFTGSDTEAIARLDSLLRDAIGLRMIADVPLGVFLSGGVDSSTVVALMQVQSSRPVKTFTIGFEEDGYNEARHAKAVACHLETDHTELYLSSAEALTVIPKLPSLYDEPYADSSQIPTYLVSALARREVTVSLSGDGGDELFAGYNRYFWGRALWKRLRLLPRPMRGTAAAALQTLSPHSWDTLFHRLDAVLPKRLKQAQPGDKIAKIAQVLAVDSPESMYRELVSHWKDPAGMVRQACEPATALTDRAQWASLPDFTQRMMFFDTVTYLPDDILVKVDRASMGVSLEAREPLLDHRIVEFAWSLPLTMKIRNGEGKWALRQVLYQYVPKELIERPKMGFGIPIDSWLRGPLREWAEALLDEHRLNQEGFFDPQPIRKKWAEHLSGKHNWQYYMWSVLMFQAWLGENA